MCWPEVTCEGSGESTEARGQDRQAASSSSDSNSSSNAEGASSSQEAAEGAGGAREAQTCEEILEDNTEKCAVAPPAPAPAPGLIPALP